jgi:multiple sugar transport system permease protein
MGLIATTGRKSPKTRLLRMSIFLLLFLGSITMVVPFMAMLTGSTRSGVDLQDLSLFPSFLLDDDALYRKYIDGLYNESPALLRSIWRISDDDFSKVTLLDKVDAEAVKKWTEFVQAYAPEMHERFAGFTATPQSRGRPLNVRRFLHAMSDQVDGDIEELNRRLGTSFVNWNAFLVVPTDTRSRQGFRPESPWWQAWHDFVEEETASWTRTSYDLQGYYFENAVVPLKGREVSGYALTSTPPEDPEEVEVWEIFVRGAVHPAYVRMDQAGTPAWQAFLQARYVEVDTFRKLTGLEVSDFSELALPGRLSEAGPLAADWQEWLQGWQSSEGSLRYEAPLSGLQLWSLDLAWKEKTGKAPPARDLNQLRFQEHRSEIRRTFLKQNYGTVWETLILYGRGLWVTVMYCGGAVLIALIVNPMAAYALSRFRPRRTYAFLLYLLLTMAFPPMVTQIPLFLMLRDFNLLNTFWALLLPGMAHGYSIFLLKGFFDSLPRDLYESASIDGAGELRMFYTITLSLSKPILAVIALSAFVNAYSSFMFALLICQDERMWTLMVWLYQMQQNYGPGVMNAAFVLAAVPTLIVFLAAQRQILRGIVIPTEK